MTPKAYRLIETDAEYEAALARMATLMNTSDEEERRELRYWAAVIEAYEAQAVPFVAIDPIDYLRNVMDLTGRSEADLARAIGSRSRASEVLGRQRALSKDMIRRLADAWNLDTRHLLGPGTARLASHVA